MVTKKRQQPKDGTYKREGGNISGHECLICRVNNLRYASNQGIDHHNSIKRQND